MYIETLTLKNYRGARSLSLNLEPKLNILAGENGTGKSTVLDAVAILLSWAISRIRHVGTSGRPIREDDITNGEAFASLELTCRHEERKISWRLTKGRKGYGAPPESSSLDDLNEYTKAIQARINADISTVKIPLFVHYPVKRAVLDIPLRIREKHSFDLLAAYENALAGEANFRTFFEWFREREDLENEMRKYQNELFKPENYSFPDSQLEAVRQALDQVLPHYRNLTVRRSPLRMEIDKDGHILKVDQLSDGEKCLIALVSDLSRRLAIANPSGQPLQGKGIVLIDEIDLHLHPKWQRMIIPKLIEAFPNCQFIVSTHSPHVLTHVQPQNIFLLNQTSNNITVEHPSESYGKNVDRILEDLMELSTTRPDVVSEGLHQIFTLIDDKQLEEARTALAKMRTAIGNDPELVKAEILIKRKELIGK